jgi:hypothetical protein
MRLRKRKAERAVSAAKQEVASRKATLANLVARGGTRRSIEGAERAVLNAETQFREAMNDQVRRVRDLERQQERLRDILAALQDPASTLAGEVPVLLLPARIETRFMQGELRVRVYPDTVHVDQLEPLPTAEEAEAARVYWRERWGTRSEADIRELWTRHTAQRPVNRFAYLVETLEPLNLDQMGSGEPEFPEVEVREPGPSRAPTAALLPSRWVVVGYRGHREVLRVTTRAVRQDLPVGPAPDDGTDEPDELPDDQDVLALDAASRWIADYDEAVAAGMAVTIGANAVEGGLERGLDLLVVLGVDVGDEPEETAAELAELLEAHRATMGLGFVAPGTPTNATGDAVPARPLADDPTARAREPIPGSAAQVAAEALGVPPDPLLGIGGAGDAVNPLTGHLHTAIWEPTLGYFLRQMLDPLADGAVAGDIRTHFRSWVRPRGPFPTLRIGRQPLGLLPVVALDHYKGGHRGEQTVANVLRRCRRFWDLGDAGRIGDSGDPTADLVELLSRTDRSVAVRVREALGPGFTANSVGAEPMMQMQEALAAFALILMGVTERAAIVDVTLLAEEEVLPVPLVTGTPSEAPLAPDYVARVLAEVRRSRGFVRLTADPEDASTLLEALLIQAARQEIARAGTSLVLGELQMTLPLELALRDEELHLNPDVVFDGPVDRPQGPLRVEAEGTAGARLSIKPVELMNQEVAAVARGKTVADHLAGQRIRDLLQDLRTRQLGEFREALNGLTGAPTRELDRTLAEAMDALSHRYDAWATSLATRRISELRGRGVRGLHIGAYGWVEDLRPDADRESAGYIHAPSIAHATTAAILRSGHLARRGEEREPLAIDLSSARAATAQRLLDGLRQGQSIESLLGYRFERALRDLGPRFAAHVRSIRLQHPLPEDAGPEPTGPVEEVAARNVVDGLALAELDPAGRTALLEAAGVPADHRAAVTGELLALSDALDAVGDLLMAESVFQAVLGNAERAAAALDVLDRQGPIPDPGVLKTPRTGSGQGHRVLLSLDHRTPPAPWRRLTDVRSAAAPRVNAWVARALGDPTRYRFHAEVLNAEGTTVEVVSVGLSDLGLSPLSLALAAGRGAGEGSELEQRLGAAFAKEVRHPDAASLRALPEPPADAPAGTEGLGVLLDAAARIGELLSAARPAGLEDLVPDTERPDPAPDIGELQTRADRVRAAVEALAGFDLAAATRASLVRGLDAAAALGLPGMLPVSDDRDALEAQLRRGVAGAVGMLAALDEIEAAPAGSPHAELMRQTARIRAVLGEDQPVVPLLNLPGSVRTELSGSAADPGLLDGAVLAPTEWLLARARVRPAVSRLWEVLAAAELRDTGVDPTQLTVTQVPWSPGERWLGLPTPPEAAPGAATASLVLHRAGLDDATAFPARFAALVVDQWQEQVPSREETTGIAFHYDGPGARAPQAALLAAPAAPDQDAWSTDGLLATVREAVELTRIRALDLDDLTAVGRFLPAVYLAFDLERQVPSLDLSRLIEQARVKWEREWRIP